MNKRHRTFIAINLPADIKKYLAKQQEKFPELPAKWTPEENVHITLVFLGDLTDEELGETCVIAKGIAAQSNGFEITFDNINYGPDQKLPPRMLWVSGQKNKELSELKNSLQDALVEKINFKPEYKTFSPHITLARISAFAWRQINPDERPQVAQDIALSFFVESIEVMESELKRGGPEYTVIESHPLNI